MSPEILGRVPGPHAPAQKESRIAAAFRETLYLKKWVSDVKSGAPSFASDSSVF